MENISCIRLVADSKQLLNCKNIIEELDKSFSVLSDALSLAGNNVRLKILFLLYTERKLCVCDLSDILEMKIPAVSQHLRKLKDKSIIKPNKQAQTIFYSLTSDYENLFLPYFQLIQKNQILESA